MLVDDESSKEQDHIFLYQATCGVGYQLAGALQRLGRKMLAWLESDEQLEDLKAVPMDSINPGKNSVQEIQAQLTLLNHFVFSFFPSNAYNEALSVEDYQKLQQFLLEHRDVLKDKHLIFLLAKNEHLERIRMLQSFPARVTIVFCPAVYGPSDHNLFDHFYANHVKGLKYPELNEPSSDFIFAGDVASALVTIMSKSTFQNSVIELVNSGDSLQQWGEAFAASFPPQTSFVKKLFKAAPFNFNVTEQEHWEKIVDQFSPKQSNSIFPENPSTSKRALGVCASALSTHPDMKLIFPPSKSP